MKRALLVILLLSGFVSNAANVYNFRFEDKTTETEKEQQPEEEKTQTPAEALTTQQPIIINNYNNNDNANKQTNGVVSAPAASPVPEPPVPETAFAEPLRSVISAKFSKLPPLRIRLASGYVDQGRGRDGLGFIIGINYDFAEKAATELYGGLCPNGLFDGPVTEYAGLDFIYYGIDVPFNKKIDRFRIGFILGGSTLNAVKSNIGSIHVGVRTILSGPEFYAITLQGKANLGNVQLELGFMIPL